MEEIDNGAKRLLAILLSAKDGAHTQAHAVIGWAKVFGVIAGDEPSVTDDQEFEVARRLVQLHQLVIEIEQQLKSIEGLQVELYLEPFPRIRSVVRLTALSGTMGSIMNQITPSDITVLKFCATELSKYHREAVVEEQWLQKFQAEIDSLFDEVIASSLPRELKEFLLRNLENTRRAVQEYRIRGVVRLKEALEQLAGAIIINESLLKDTKDSEQVGKFSKVFHGLVSIVTFASKVTPLIGPAAQAVGLLLPADPNSIPPVPTQ